MTPRVRRFALLALSALAAPITLSVIGAVAQSAHWLDDPAVARSAELAVLRASFGVFLLLGFSSVPVFVHLFVVMQTRIGNGERAPIRWLRAHEVAFTRGVWAVYALGLAIAAPELRRELRLGATENVLVARIGMPLDEVRERSSLALGEGAAAAAGGARAFLGATPFAFEVADAGVRFEDCGSYFLLAGEGDGAPVVAVSVALARDLLPHAALAAQLEGAAQQLAAAGWLAGREAGPPAGDPATYWRHGDTVAELRGRRLDETRPDAWIPVIELREHGARAGLEFEPPSR